MSKFGGSYPPGAANDPFAPYNQDAGDDEHCIYCGAELPDDVTDFSDIDESAADEGFCNDSHRTLFDTYGSSENYGKPHLNPAEETRYAFLRERLIAWESNRAPNPAILADILSFVPAEDFEWEAQEAGDWHVYNCGENDCDQQWHLVAYAEDYSRRNGKLAIDLRSVDADGNWEFDSGWDETDDDASTFESVVGYALGSNRLDDYFKGWANYWLDATITGKDPCDQALSTPENWTTFCLDAAEKQIKCLTQAVHTAPGAI